MKQVTDKDLSNLTDAKADPADRVQALMRLSHWEKGKYDRLEPTIAGLLKDPNAAVRGGAIKTLLANWERDKYLDAAIAMLLKDRDEDWTARADTAFALGQYAFYTGKERERVLRALATSVRDDPEWPVQERAYEQFLRLAAPEREPTHSGEFDRQRDVDWELLKPYLS